MNHKIITINIPNQYLDCIKVLTDHGVYPSRSETVREALRQFLSQEGNFLNDIAPKRFERLKTPEIVMMETF